MRLRRIAGAAAAVTVVAGGGLLLSSPTHAASPTPITLSETGMSSTSCPVPPLGVYGTIAFKPSTVVQFKQGTLVPGSTSESLTIQPAPNSTDPNSKSVIATVPAAGSAPITFSRATTYNLTWQFKAIDLLGVVAVKGKQTGKLVINSNATGCAVAVQVPVPSVSASVVPSPVTSAINGAVGGVVGGVNGALSPVNSALPSLPAVPGLPSVPGLPGGSGSSSGGGSQSGAPVPGTTYRPHGPTVADRTVPKGYGAGSGQGGVYVPANGSSINANALPATGTGSQAGSRSASSSSAVKSGGSPRTVELATSRPRSALGALPTLAVILAILALSGTTAFYARTFLLQPAAAVARAKPRS